MPRDLPSHLSRILLSRQFSSEHDRPPVLDAGPEEWSHVRIFHRRNLGEPAGIVLREGNAYRFHAIARPFFELDGSQFATAGHARLAAAQLRRTGNRNMPRGY